MTCEKSRQFIEVEKMKRFTMSLVSVVLAFTIFFMSLPPVWACGPFSVDPLFSFTRHLDYPIEDHTNDKIGIVPASFGRISLFVFYRQLNNLPFAPGEKSEVTRAIQYRIGNSQDYEDSPVPEKPKIDPNDPVEKWKAARAKVTGSVAKTETEKLIPNDYNSYTNCLEDAYRNAANTLNSRVASYGNNDSVKEWLSGQDAVFSNCGDTGKTPRNVADGSPEWLKKDRQYQIAAALFYGEKFAESRLIFENISNDDSSPWRNTAKFVVARTYIREASFIDDGEADFEQIPVPKTNSNAANSATNRIANTFSNRAVNAMNTATNSTYSPNPDRTEYTKGREIKSIAAKMAEKAELLEKAEKQLESVVADTRMREFYDSSRRLLNLVRYRGNPKEQRKLLAAKLSDSGENSDIFNNLTDYVWLLDKVESAAREQGEAREQKEAEAAKKEYNYNYTLKVRDIAKDELGRDLTDWLYSYQADDSFEHSFAKWKETKKLSWYVAAISKAQKDSPQLLELLTEADRTPVNSPAYPTVRYHQIQLLLLTGKPAEAKQKLNEVMGAGFKTLSRSTQNKFIAERMTLAENLEEFLKYAQRQAATFVWTDDGNEQGDDLKLNKELIPWKNRTMFDMDSVAFFNEKMPLSVLREAALSRNLPDHLTGFLVIAVWTRAFMLGNQSIQNEFAPLVAKYKRNYDPSFTRLAASSGAANTEAAALLGVLRNPTIQPFVPIGMGREGSAPTSIDSIRGNWWCPQDQNIEGHSHYDNYEFRYPTNYPDFLAPGQKTAAASEHKQLLANGAAGTYLAKRALDFATKNAGNPSVPEILHLAVRATRYGCTDAETLKVSKACFDYLQKKFAGNEWTKKTPYYFGNRESNY